jgi:hypothetical protein
MAGKPVHVAFGGGRPTSDTGILLLVAAEQLADGILLARCDFDTIRLCPFKVAGRVTEMVTHIKRACYRGPLPDPVRHVRSPHRKPPP